MNKNCITKPNYSLAKVLCILLIVFTILITFCACNYNIVDTKWQYDYAYITLPNGRVIETEIQSWTEDSNSITIQGKDGQVYSVSYHNCMMTKNKWDMK